LVDYIKHFQLLHSITFCIGGGPFRWGKIKTNLARQHMSETSIHPLTEPVPDEAPEYPSPLPLHQLPPPPGDFTGRKKALEELVEKVRFDGACIVGLFGMGGIGKTALGLRLAEELTPRYPDAQIYLNLGGSAGQHLSPLRAMAHVIRAFDPGFPETPVKLDIDGHYSSVLNERRAIIFLDDVVDREQVVRLIPPAGCLLLITSQKSFALPGLIEKYLDPLTTEEAQELVLRVAPRLEGRAGEMATLCGCLPAALRKAANLLVEHRDMTVETCLRRLSQPDERRALVDASVATGYKRLSTELRRIWRWLSVFPGKFDASDAAEICGMNQGEVQDVLSMLISCFMLEWSESDPGYKMHELLRLCADGRCTDEERRSTRKKLSDHSVTLLARANELYLQGGEALGRGLALFDTQRLNIESGWAWASAHAAQEEWADQLCVRFPIVGSDILDIRQTPDDRIRWLQAPLAAAHRLKDHSEEAILLRDAGTAYYNMGDIQHAIDYYTQALTLARETGDRRTEEGALAGLGLAYARNGNFPHALEYHEKGIALSREISDRRRECHSISHMARTHSLMANVREAMELCEQALAIARETGDLCAEARLLGDMAAALLASGKTRQAIDVGSQSLQRARGIGDRLQEEAVLDTLGKCYSVLGDSRRSIECHESRLKIARELGDRYGEGDALGNLGNACARSGDIRRSLGYHQELLSLVRGLGDRRGEATVLGNIGKARLKLGEIRIAVECQSERLLIAREIGDRHIEGSALWNMSLALEKLGNRLQAISHAEAARKIFEDDGNAQSVTVKKQLSEWTARSSRAH
jgi:tetratricopeptide (TPR) repeat protein